MAQSEITRPLTAAEQLEQAKKMEAEAKKAVSAAKAAAKKAKKEEKAQSKKAAKNSNAGNSGNGIPTPTPTPEPVTVQEPPTGTAAPAPSVPVLPVTAPAQGESSKWTAPQHAAAQGKEKPLAPQAPQAQAPKSNQLQDAKYLEGAIPEVDGRVVFKYELDVPGKTAQDIYQATYLFLDRMAKEDNQQPTSGIALYNEEEHVIAAQFKEWLTFTDKFLSLDRTEFSYTIIATCTEGHLSMTLERMSYNYEPDRPSALKTTAEKWITDKYALNKSKTRLLPSSGKFRRKTIDRKDDIFQKVTYELLK